MPSTTTSRLLSSIEAGTSKIKDTVTQNGAATFSTTGSDVLNLFSRAGGLRGKNEEALELFKKAYVEDPALAVTLLFHIRDIRQGIGERDLFRACFKYLCNKKPSLAASLLPAIPEYGRWDDVLYGTLGTRVYKKALKFYTLQLVEDSLKLLEALKLGEDVSKVSITLAGKWAPSHTANPIRKQLTKDLMDVLGFEEFPEYTQMTSLLRKHIDIVERKLTSRNYDAIDYSQLPARAIRKYIKAFRRNDGERINAFFSKVESGEAKVKAGTLAPYELAFKLINSSNYKTSRSKLSDEELRLAEAQWKALPDYLKGKHNNALCVVDTSGSMTSMLPKSKANALSVALSLGLYLAERADGPWKDHFITFSCNPHLVKLSGKSLQDKLVNMSKADWTMSTDLQSVFTLILNSAKSNNLTQEDMPETIFIVSDMQFNCAVPGNTMSNFEAIERKYEDAGYIRPNIVFWNVDSKASESPVKFNEQGVALISGLNASGFSNVLSGNFNPYTVMLKKLVSSRYETVLRLASESFGEDVQNYLNAVV